MLVNRRGGVGQGMGGRVGWVGVFGLVLQRCSMQQVRQGRWGVEGDSAFAPASTGQLAPTHLLAAPASLPCASATFRIRANRESRAACAAPESAARPCGARESAAASTAARESAAAASLDVPGAAAAAAAAAGGL